jgi:hypothetical protein
LVEAAELDVISDVVDLDDKLSNKLQIYIHEAAYHTCGGKCATEDRKI